jgi:hypothetical protein
MSKINIYGFLNDKKITLFTDGIGPYTAVTTPDAILGSVFIPANTFTSGDVVTIECNLEKSGTTNGTNYNFYYNTELSISTAATLSTRGLASTFRSIYHMRRMVIRNSSGAGEGTLISGVLTGFDTDFSAFNAAVSVLNLNWTVDSYIIIGGRTAAGGDLLRCNYLKVSN